MLILAAMIGYSPLFSYANGEHTPGTVLVSGNGITAAYSVRYNPSVSKGRFDFYIVNNTIFTTGVDSATGAGFSCYTSVSNPVYPAMKDAAYGSGNGAVVTIYRNGAICSSIAYRNASNYLE